VPVCWAKLRRKTKAVPVRKVAVVPGARPAPSGVRVGALTAALITPGRPKPMTRLDDFVERFFAYSRAHRQLHYLLFHEAGFSEEDAFAGVRTVLRRFIDHGMSAGEIAHGDVDLTTDFLLAGVHGSLVSALHGPPDDTPHILAATKRLSRRLLTPPSS
jgi:hypothetical protein